MGRAAKKEFVTHKVLIYETLASYMEQDVPEVNEVVDRMDDDESSLRWYSVTSLDNYEPFYNMDPVILQANDEEEVDGVKANIEKDNEEMMDKVKVEEFEKVLQEINNSNVDAEALVDPASEHQEMITLTPKKKKESVKV